MMTDTFLGVIFKQKFILASLKQHLTNIFFSIPFKSLESVRLKNKWIQQWCIKFIKSDL